MSRKAVLAAVLACCAYLPAVSVYAKKSKTPVAPVVPQMSGDQKILHALNRLTYGPRPGDVEMIKKIGGLDRWIEIQLHPEMLPENSKLLTKLQPLDSLMLPPDIMIDTYPPPQLIRAMVDGRAPFPEDPVTRLLIRREMQRYEIQNEAK